MLYPQYLRLSAAALLLASTAAAAELRLQFVALERLLGQTVFTEDGRKFMIGSPDTKCNSAFLEHPQIRGVGGLVRLRARFTGRTTRNIFGQCKSSGDAFDIVITARPAFSDGNIGLREVTAAAEGNAGTYARQVCVAIAGSLAHDFRYPLYTEARTSLEGGGDMPGYKREVTNFQVTEVRVTEDALILVLDFALVVK